MLCLSLWLPSSLARPSSLSRLSYSPLLMTLSLSLFLLLFSPCLAHFLFHSLSTFLSSPPSNFTFSFSLLLLYSILEKKLTPTAYTFFYGWNWMVLSLPTNKRQLKHNRWCEIILDVFEKSSSIVQTNCEVRKLCARVWRFLIYCDISLY